MTSPGSQRPMKAFGITGRSGSGKTTLLERLVPRLLARGLSVSLIKHSHKEVDVDRPGKDSYRHREAGCREVLLASEKRWALMHELRGAPEPRLAELLAVMSPVDLVLIEGFKADDCPRLEVYRPSTGTEPLFPGDATILAVASDVAVPGAPRVLSLGEVEAIADFVLAHAGTLEGGRVRWSRSPG